MALFFVRQYYLRWLITLHRQVHVITVGQIVVTATVVRSDTQPGVKAVPVQLTSRATKVVDLSVQTRSNTVCRSEAVSVLAVSGRPGAGVAVPEDAGSCHTTTSVAAVSRVTSQDDPRVRAVAVAAAVNISVQVVATRVYRGVIATVLVDAA